MQTYYFQIYYPDKAWEDIKATERQCINRAAAVEWAYYLSGLNHGYTVRMTDNPRLFQGSYFKASKWMQQNVGNNTNTN